MDYVVVKPTGFYQENWIYDEEKEEGSYVQQPLDGRVLEFLQCWNVPVKLEPMTLNDFLALVHPSKNKMLLRVIEALTNCSILPFFQELQEEAPSGNKDVALEKIQIQKFFQVEDYSRYNGKREGDHFVTASAIGPADSYENDHYCIEFDHWALLKNLPLVIKNDTFLSLNETDDIRDIRNIDCYMEITLGEFITALFGELCFFPDPTSRDEQFTTIKKRIEEVDNGTATLVEWKDVDDARGTSA